ncbi:hypothetical protein [Oceanobacter sp. 2_MG-2023]|nr:hypothetical protein [Oceanobacter sp. 2_MG-2023]
MLLTLLLGFTNNTQALSTIEEIVNSTRLIALGDIHGSEKPVNFLINTLKQPAIANKIDNIVVEFGNAQYQALADDYLLKGVYVAPETLRQIWRNTLYFMAWQTPQYQRLIEFLRYHNATRAHKIRLVLADPAFDWATIRRDEWETLTVTREDTYQNMVESEVLEKHQTAILLFGAFHQLKRPLKLQGKPDVFNSLVSRLVQSGTNVITLWPHMGAALDTTRYQAPTLIDLGHDPFGQQRLSDLSDRFLSDQPLSYIADYYLYQGADPRDAKPAANNTTDKAWHAEMARRARLIGGRVESQVNNWLTRHAH